MELEAVILHFYANDDPTDIIARIAMTPAVARRRAEAILELLDHAPSDIRTFSLPTPGRAVELAELNMRGE